MNSLLTSISAVFLDEVLVFNVEDFDFDQMRGFEEKPSIYSTEKLNLPTSKDFSFNMSGSLRIPKVGEDNEIAGYNYNNTIRKLVNMSNEELRVAIFIGGESIDVEGKSVAFLMGLYKALELDVKTGNVLGYELPVYVETFEITAEAGDLVSFSASFKKAGKIQLIEGWWSYV